MVFFKKITMIDMINLDNELTGISVSDIAHLTINSVPIEKFKLDLQKKLKNELLSNLNADTNILNGDDSVTWDNIYE